MSNDKNVPDNHEEELRRQIRQRLLEQTQRIADELKNLEQRESRKFEAERIRKIVEEERNAFYTNLGYVKIIDEDGTVEWIPPEHAQALEDKIGEDLDDLENGQRKVRWFAVGWISISVLMLVILSFFLWTKPGSVRVTSNISNARIILDNDTTILFTDSILTQVNPGHHIVSVAKLGYRVKGRPYQDITIKQGDRALVFFELEPTPLPPVVKPVSSYPLEQDTLYERLKRTETEKITAFKYDTVKMLDSVKHQLGIKF